MFRWAPTPRTVPAYTGSLSRQTTCRKAPARGAARTSRKNRAKTGRPIREEITRQRGMASLITGTPRPGGFWSSREPSTWGKRSPQIRRPCPTPTACRTPPSPISGRQGARRQPGCQAGSSYTLTEGDEGLTIQVWLSFTDDAGNVETLTSPAIAAVQPVPNNPSTGQPSITGTVQVGETLTADTSSISDSDGLENATFSYQWLADEVAIQGATGSSYTLVSSDVGKAIKVTVPFTDDAANPESLTSVATGEVTNAEPTEPPPAPTNLTAVANADGSVTLIWDAPQRRQCHRLPDAAAKSRCR